MTGVIPLAPEKAAAWAAEWKEKHAPGRTSFAPSFGDKRAPRTVVNFDSWSAQAILAIERQINGGEQITRLPKGVV